MFCTEKINSARAGLPPARAQSRPAKKEMRRAQIRQVIDRLAQSRIAQMRMHRDLRVILAVIAERIGQVVMIDGSQLRKITRLLLGAKLDKVGERLARQVEMRADPQESRNGARIGKLKGKTPATAEKGFELGHKN